MSISSVPIFSIKGQSAEAVRESIARIWESCLPKRKVIQKSQCYIPDLNKPIVVRKKKEDIIQEAKERFQRSKVDIDQVKNSTVNSQPVVNETSESSLKPRSKLKSTLQILFWRTHVADSKEKPNCI